MAQTAPLTHPDPPGDLEAGIAAWRQWRARCALLKCDPASASALRGFAGSRAAALLRRMRTAVPGLPDLGPGEAWHLFESHLVTRATRTGKRYKAWLFARADRLLGKPYLDAVQGGAFLVLRSALREFFRGEAPQAMSVALDAPIPGTRGLTLNDLMPAPDESVAAVEAAEIDTLARREARAAFDEATQRERLVLCLRSMDLPLQGAAVESAAGCGRTALHAAHREFIVRLAESIRRTYRAEAPGVAHAIAQAALQEVRKMAMIWEKSDKTAARLFYRMGRGRATGPARPRKESARR